MPHKKAKRSLREQERSKQGRDVAPSKNALSNEVVPKCVSRVLDAARVQQEWHNKKRKLSEDQRGNDNEKPAKRKRKAAPDGAQGAKNSKSAGIKIQQGETLSHFNRRVEESMRPLVRDAMQSSAATARKVKKDEEEAAASSKSSKSQKAAPTDVKSSRTTKKAQAESDANAIKNHSAIVQDKHKDRPKDFAALSTSAPRRLNDIVTAPPEIKKLPRGAKPNQPSNAEGKKTSSLRDGVLSMAQKAMLEGERDRVIEAYRELKKRNAAG